MTLGAVDVLTFGETMMSLRAEGPLRLGRDVAVSVAGSESNVAICLSRLGHRVRWVGRLGADEPGALVLRTLMAEGVDTSAVVQDGEAPTGLIFFDEPLPHTRAVTYYRTGSAGSRLSDSDIEAALAAGARALHVTGITCAVSESAAQAVVHAVDRARAAGMTVCLDVNYRSKMWSPEAAGATLAPLATRADIVIGSPTELALLAPGDRGRRHDASTAAADLLDRGVAEVVTKLGAEGARVDTLDGAHSVVGHQVNVVDTIGAGDAFCAGYLSAWLVGEDAQSRLQRANALGAIVVGSRGDWEAAPRRGDLELFGRADSDHR